MGIYDPKRWPIHDKKWERWLDESGIVAVSSVNAL
jgi:hypothetical protein